MLLRQLNEFDQEVNTGKSTNEVPWNVERLVSFQFDN